MSRRAIEWAEIPLRPWRGVQFVDSHLHLDRLSDPGAIAYASANGAILASCGIDRQSSLDGIVLSLGHPEVIKAFVGVHPSEALNVRELGWVKTAIDSATGIGEIGLDPKYSKVGGRSRQMVIFEKLLGLAQRASKPVQIHAREAEVECLQALSGYDLKEVLMHWFESETRFSEVMGRGYLVSFGPAIIYSKKLQRLAAAANRDQVLVETDSPVTYAPLGRVGGPMLVPSVVFKIAELWGETFDETASVIARNSARFLGLPGKG